MNIKLLGAGIFALALAACSTQPSQPVAARPAAQAVVPAANGKPSSFSRSLIAAGYKATPLNGTVYYCRQEDVIGTVFKKKVCLDEAHMRDQQREIEDMRGKMMNTQASPGCLGPTCKDP